MENEDEIRSDDSLESLEEFFNKDVNTTFTPQELMVLSIFLACGGVLLELYQQHTNIGVFEVEPFIKNHPEYAHIDFNNLNNLENKDILNEIREIMKSDDNKREEFNKGDIILDSMIDVITNILTKLYASYMTGYGTKVPVETMQFFTMLESCLQNPINALQSFFNKNS